MVTASLLGDVVLAVVIGGGLLGLALLRPGAGRRRGRRGQMAGGPLASDLPIGRVVIASGLARSRRR